MNNFGVIELASTKTTHAPGWAYVPDHPGSSNPSKSVSAVHLHVNRNKRAARHANASASTIAQQQDDISARHDSKLAKEIEQLQRDSLGGRDVHVPIPSSGSSGGGRDKDGKIRGHTANVRKILASQKTFANHLDDFEAWSRSQPVGGGGAGVGAGGEGGSGAGSAGHSAAGTPVPTSATTGGGASGGGGVGGSNKRGAAAPKKGVSSSGATAKGRSSANSKKSVSTTPTPAPPPPPPADQDTAMRDASPLNGEDRPDAVAPALLASGSKILTPFVRFTPPPHPGDSNPLLESWLPPLPTDDELRELVRAPPLNYNQARGRWTEDDTRYPTRHFCEVCGYWGRIKCMKCGTRVCALDCLDLHREECVTRYGL
ncbi:hypothetical protein BD289DRAFT_429056 [Coniella lustricola]|uniref:HIT-type domain-containing protein n=1 Tax=Coniella lustricola TaxID=2025994 RepID=A0A2T3AD74_9PEZI|nr:hypothetical protein BD289DRAFT_429056 [Coniella lustricola]